VALSDDIETLPLVISPGITPQINGNAIIIHRALKALAGLLGHTAFGRSVVKVANAEEARGLLGAGTSSLTLGITSTTAAAGNDSRLSDARTPVDHTHQIQDINASGIRNGTTFLAGDGTWKVPADVAGEVQYSELTAVISLPTSSTMTDIAGLSLSFAATNRPVMVEVNLAGVACSGEGQWQFRVINTNNTVLAEDLVYISAAEPETRPPMLKFRVPASTASSVYKVQASRVAGTLTGTANPRGRRAYIQAVRA
jgi:hypothetical protein